ncbi:UDP-N-acetylmuramoyl-tripeptide--D-alanyl-D-alanine ligase [Rubrobacter xylanophilus DSM 9941]|uniref:UDP-N-acetylmuramoyl-tripeptide--D-alanyl-D-alanine ligase n=1 Tax=Rubrobacter xylanophilus (strain DSM 9941 / JCM 11954 / NBRC 16129 / PRD-1) TaxID=266117 RepID=Q1AVW9_RUBXD|nr:UDP-N-acetylmuramoyl-tripeptide--D-alanyl-D-alanine ligase [Rubrobacter xylanophilus]ABG04459.1 UDP-N-acetylmuramoyl-tripeptide--D-alanyl-D-alanine ligase [Rubrobacter xylanophilus DSM 9941]
MREATLSEISRAIGARLHGTDGGERAHGAAVDSRAVRGGELFFALRGRLDGADFAPDARARGAVAAVADRPLEVPTLVVEDPLRALQELARWSLRREASATVVGITGTVGKTTTKDALATILRSAGRKITATQGNLNNEIGLPLTVLNAAPDTEVMVLEMGATHPGDIAFLCGIARPHVGVLTAISPVHLDSFGSLQKLAETKGELARSLPEDGAFVSPVGVPEAAVGGGRAFGRHITFGDEGASLWASGVEETEEGLRFTVHAFGESAAVRAPVHGTHLVRPLLAATGGALALGVALEECARGLSRLRRTGLRGDLLRLRDDILLYDDSYNASPAAMAAVLRYGARQASSSGRRLVAVLGGMFELGPGAREYHREAGRLAAEVGVDLLVCVGEEAGWYAEAFDGEKVLYRDAGEAARELPHLLRPGDYVLVKGSRGVRLDTLTGRLKESLAVV